MSRLGIPTTITLNRIASRPNRFGEPTVNRRHPATLIGSPGSNPSYIRPMSDLFAAAKLENDAPRPLADRLRPQKLDEVVGQDHLVGPEGALTRLIASGSLG